jgi:type II secretory pathway pseudopilin PulG
MKRNKKGITVLELLAAIIILGIITAIAVPIYKTYISKASSLTIEMEEKEILKSVDAWYQKQKSIPLAGNQNISFEQLKTNCGIDMVTYSTPKLCKLDLTQLIKEGKINFQITDTYYIYYINNGANGIYSVSNDYPKEYIKVLVENYKKTNAQYPLIAGSQQINASLLPKVNPSTTNTDVLQGAILSTPQPKFKYILLTNNLVDRLTNQD